MKKTIKTTVLTLLGIMTLMGLSTSEPSRPLAVIPINYPCPKHIGIYYYLDGELIRMDSATTSVMYGDHFESNFLLRDVRLRTDSIVFKLE